MYCKQCGVPLKPDAQFCVNCGAKSFDQATEPQPPPPQYAPPMGHGYQNRYDQQGGIPYPPPGFLPPVDTTPLRVTDYLLMFLLQIIPLANFIMMIVWACDKRQNPNRRNYSIAVLIVMGIGVALGVVLVLLFISLADTFDYLPYNYF